MLYEPLNQKTGCVQKHFIMTCKGYTYWKSLSGSKKTRERDEKEGGEKMASRSYSTYSQAAAQQGFSAYATSPLQGYAQTTQAWAAKLWNLWTAPLMSAIPRLRPQPMGRPPMQLLVDSLPLDVQLQLPPGIQSTCPGVRHWRLRHHHCHGCDHPRSLLCSSACIWYSACLPSLWTAASSHHARKTAGW